jgi:hypothetical protein
MKVGAAVATTRLLVIEVAEHARWAKQHCPLQGSPLSTKTLIAATGRAGLQANVFIEGFLEEIAKGSTTADFGSYLDKICGHPGGHAITDEAFIAALEKSGIPCLGLNEWDGFEDVLWNQRDELQALIAGRRNASKTYKHDRQVRAEAEAVIIARNIRAKQFSLNARQFANAYFVSNSRSIDHLTGPELPITMRPQAILQWLSTVTVCDTEELGSLVHGLLWELSERKLDIVDRQRLRVFSPLAAVSREQLQEELSQTVL